MIYSFPKIVIDGAVRGVVRTARSPSNKRRPPSQCIFIATSHDCFRIASGCRGYRSMSEGSTKPSHLSLAIPSNANFVIALPGGSPIVDISGSSAKPGPSDPAPQAWMSDCRWIERFDRSIRMLRIDRSANGQVVFTLSGRMQTEDIEQVRQLLAVESSGQPVRLDLRHVTLVNRDAVTFLGDCEAEGVKLESCPLYIRNWIDQAKRRNK
jgi:hypothetical protein